MPDDLEWPRRVIVGAIVVTAVTRLAIFAERAGVVHPRTRFGASKKERPPQGGLAVQCAGPK